MKFEDWQAESIAEVLPEPQRSLALNLHKRLQSLEEAASQAKPPATESPITDSPSAAAEESTAVTMKRYWQSLQAIMGAGPVARLCGFVEGLDALTPSDKIAALDVVLDMSTYLRQVYTPSASPEAGVWSPSTAPNRPQTAEWPSVRDEG